MQVVHFTQETLYKTTTAKHQACISAMEYFC